MAETAELAETAKITLWTAVSLRLGNYWASIVKHYQLRFDQLARIVAHRIFQCTNKSVSSTVHKGSRGISGMVELAETTKITLWTA